MIGRSVEIRSIAGIAYHGIVRAIRDGGELGELFEIGSEENSEYRRLVFVTDRQAQIQDMERKV